MYGEQPGHEFVQSSAHRRVSGERREGDRPLRQLAAAPADHDGGQEPPRTTPLVYTTDDPDASRLVIIASKGGSPTNPDWYHNLVANPTATVELPRERFAVRAIIPGGADATGSSPRWPRRCPSSTSTNAKSRAGSRSSCWSALDEAR